MITLNTLTNTTRPYKAPKRVGRGLGSKLGKTCGRGEKGRGSRAGCKSRAGKEGGNMPLFMKIPIRGFNNKRFRREMDVVNLEQLDFMFEDGETVTVEALQERGFLSGPTHGIKLLGKGDLTKKLIIRLQSISDSAKEKLTAAKIDFQIQKLS